MLRGIIRGEIPVVVLPVFGITSSPTTVYVRVELGKINFISTPVVTTPFPPPNDKQTDKRAVVKKKNV